MSDIIHVGEKLVTKIAALAHLDLSQEETELFVSQFKDTLDEVEPKQLEELHIQVKE